MRVELDVKWPQSHVSLALWLEERRRVELTGADGGTLVNFDGA